jgi:hypothetical protein
MSGFLGILGLIMAAQAAIAFQPLPWPWRLGLALAAFPAAAGLIALVMGLFQGYWH